MTTFVTWVVILYLAWLVVKFIWCHGTLSKRNTWK
jgi:hypothetical protein